MVTRKGLPPTRGETRTDSLTPSLKGALRIVDGARVLWERGDSTRRDPYHFPNDAVRLSYGETWGGRRALWRRIMNAWGKCMLWGR